MLLIIGIVLIILWGGGLLLHIGGALIHIILVLALISIVFNFLTGRKV